MNKYTSLICSVMLLWIGNAILYRMVTIMAAIGLRPQPWP